MSCRASTCRPAGCCLRSCVCHVRTMWTGAVRDSCLSGTNNSAAACLHRRMQAMLQQTDPARRVVVASAALAPVIGAVLRSRLPFYRIMVRIMLLPGVSAPAPAPLLFCPGKTLQNRSVSSPAPVTMVWPSGATARYSTLQAVTATGGRHHKHSTTKHTRMKSPCNTPTGTCIQIHCDADACISTHYKPASATRL